MKYQKDNSMKKAFIMAALITQIPAISKAARAESIEDLTPQEIHLSAPTLSDQECADLLHALNDKLSHASRNEEKATYEALIKSFYQGLYSQVVAQLKELGENVQQTLHITGLREQLLLGNLNRQPWYIQDIAALATQQFASNNDKIIYLESLTNLLNSHSKDLDAKVLAQAINELLAAFGSCTVHGIFATKINHSIELLQSITVAQ